MNSEIAFLTMIKVCRRQDYIRKEELTKYKGNDGIEARKNGNNIREE